MAWGPLISVGREVPDELGLGGTCLRDLSLKQGRTLPCGRLPPCPSSPRTSPAAELGSGQLIPSLGSGTSCGKTPSPPVAWPPAAPSGLPPPSSALPQLGSWLPQVGLVPGSASALKCPAGRGVRAACRFPRGHSDHRFLTQTPTLLPKSQEGGPAPEASQACATVVGAAGGRAASSRHAKGSARCLPVPSPCCSPGLRRGAAEEGCSPVGASSRVREGARGPG